MTNAPQLFKVFTIFFEVSGYTLLYIRVLLVVKYYVRYEALQNCKK